MSLNWMREKSLQRALRTIRSAARKSSVNHLVFTVICWPLCRPIQAYGLVLNLYLCCVFVFVLCICICVIVISSSIFHLERDEPESIHWSGGSTRGGAGFWTAKGGELAQDQAGSSHADTPQLNHRAKLRRTAGKKRGGGVEKKKLQARTKACALSVLIFRVFESGRHHFLAGVQTGESVPGDRGRSL